MYPYYQYKRKAHYLSPPSHYNPYYHPNYFVHYPNQRQMSPVNPALFMTSAKHMKIIMKDASILLDKMSDSRKFSLDLMAAAQVSNKEKVNQMLKGTGIQTMPEVTYTPDGMKLNFLSYVEDMNCCQLSLSLRWM